MRLNARYTNAHSMRLNARLANDENYDINKNNEEREKKIENRINTKKL